MLKKIIGMLLCIFATLLAQGDLLEVIGGNVYVKSLNDTLYKKLTDKDYIASNTEIISYADAVFTINGYVKIYTKDSVRVNFSSSAEDVSLELKKGQICFIENSKPNSPKFSVISGKCKIVPIGTAAAIKNSNNGNVSVAVLEGKIRFDAGDNNVVDIEQGKVCSYIASSNSLSGIKPVSAKAAQYFKSWVGIEVKGVSNVSMASEENKNMDNKGNSQGSILPEETEKSDENKRESKENVENKAVQQKTGQAEKIDKTVDQSTSVATDVKQIEADKAKEDSNMNEKTKSEQPQDKDKKTTQTSQKSTASVSGNKPQWEVSAGMVTIDDEQWTRIALGVDVPIWRFGVFFDVELFLDSKGNFSSKGWNFNRDNWLESLLRKIRYIRFNHEGDPVFVKIGGLDNVTMGYGFIVDNFTNMLNYPGEKLFGLQFELNNVSPIGIDFQFLIPDFKDFGNDGGIIASRLGFRPFKSTNVPVIKGLLLSGTFAGDLNQYAPARKWDYSVAGNSFLDNDIDKDGITDSVYLFNKYFGQSFYDSLIAFHKANNDYDTLIATKDYWAKDVDNDILIAGGDLSLPLINGKVVNLVLYGQGAFTIDDDNESKDKFYKGWGIGAPGLMAKLGPVSAKVEYRHTKGKFVPGYFNTYYLEERIRRYPSVLVKEQTLADNSLNGVFGAAGFTINGFFNVNANYQYMISKDKKDHDQRFEALGAVGEKFLEKVPKISKAEMFYYQTNIVGNIFKKSVDTFWGYRLGAEVISNTAIIWETRYGWIKDENGKLKKDKTINILASLKF